MLKKICLMVLFVSPWALAQTPASDAEIATVLVTINEGEIDAAQVADGRAQNQEVKEFAKMMRDQHKENMKETKKVAKDYDIKMKAGDLSRKLKEEAKKSNKDLKDNSKIAFDKAYLRQQVTMHEKALATLNDTLIPNAKDPEFKLHLEKTRDAVAKHLDHAKMLDTKIQ